MKGPHHKRYTVDNINATNNIVCGCRVRNRHSPRAFGNHRVYGYSSIGMTIPEGYMNVKVDVEGQEKEMEIFTHRSPVASTI